MELFIPSVLLLLLAAAIIFFVLPRFGAATLALISIVLLGFGIYQHMNSFGAEYRAAGGAPLNLMGYAPYIMVGGVLVVIALYLINLSPLGKSNTTAPSLPEIPTVAEMPSANTATNAVTAGVNNALKGITNAAAAVGVANAAKNNANKGLFAAVANTANNALTGITNTLTGNTSKNNTGGIAEALGFGNTKPSNNKGIRVPGLNFPLSQV